MENKLFIESQSQEAIARIGFYFKKYISDLDKFERFCNHFQGIENVLKEEGSTIYFLIKDQFVEIANKWETKISCLNYSNQPYNFTYKRFKEINKVNNII